MLMKISKYPLSIIMIIIIPLVLILYIFMPQKEISEMENRYLTQRPGISFDSLLDGSFMEEFDTYTAEQLPFRDAFIKLKAYLSQALFMKENNGVALGKEGYLFEKTIGVDKQLYKNEEIFQKFLRDFCKSGHKGNCYVMIAPNASAILEDKLPLGMPNVNQKKMICDFYELIEECNLEMSIYADNKDKVKLVDLFDTFVKKDEEGVNLYYKTDHHWTSDGAYYAYAQLCKEMDSNPVEITMLSKNQADNFYGTLYAKYKGRGTNADTIDYYDIPVESYSILQRGDGAKEGEYSDLYDKSKLDLYDKYSMFMYGNSGLSRIVSNNSDNQEVKKLIVIKDSYANSIIPFLTFQFDIVDIIDLRYFKGKMDEYLSENEDSDILILYNFSNFMTDNHFYKLVN